jgi:GntR family transcriptional regulator
MKKNTSTTTQTSLPVYIQISELLTREITAGLYAAGDRLPPEAELAAKLGVAVGTLRKALSELESRGMLERRQGSGTYVRQTNSTAHLSKSVYEFFKLELLGGGGLPSAIVASFDKIDTPEAFQTSFSKKCYRVRRLRLLSGTPAALEEIYFDAAQHPKLKQEDLGVALYLFYKESLGFWIASAEDRVGLGIAPDWTLGGFAPKAGDVCPRVERISRASDGIIREYSVTWFDANVCRYVNRLK